MNYCFSCSVVPQQSRFEKSIQGLWCLARPTGRLMILRQLLDNKA